MIKTPSFENAGRQGHLQIHPGELVTSAPKRYQSWIYEDRPPFSSPSLFQIGVNVVWKF